MIVDRAVAYYERSEFFAAVNLSTRSRKYSDLSRLQTVASAVLGLTVMGTDSGKTLRPCLTRFSRGIRRRTYESEH